MGKKNNYVHSRGLNDELCKCEDQSRSAIYFFVDFFPFASGLHPSARPLKRVDCKCIKKKKKSNCRFSLLFASFLRGVGGGLPLKMACCLSAYKHEEKVSAASGLLTLGILEYRGIHECSIQLQ